MYNGENFMQVGAPEPRERAWLETCEYCGNMYGEDDDRIEFKKDAGFWICEDCEEEFEQQDNL
jgi:hypothetical protein